MASLLEGKNFVKRKKLLEKDYKQKIDKMRLELMQKTDALEKKEAEYKDIRKNLDENQVKVFQLKKKKKELKVKISELQDKLRMYELNSDRVVADVSRTIKIEQDLKGYTNKLTC
jgi:chromosome segregation ATPase